MKLRIIANIDGKEYPLELFVFPKMPLQAIIGIDLIRRLKMSLDFNKEQLKIENHQTKLERYQNTMKICDIWVEKKEMDKERE